MVQFSLRFAPKSPIDSKSALVQVVAWCQTGDKAIIWTNDGLVFGCEYTSFGLNELITMT